MKALWITTLWRTLRAIVTAPDVAHWVKKYDAAKAEWAAAVGLADKFKEQLHAAEDALQASRTKWAADRFQLEKVQRGLDEARRVNQTLHKEMAAKEASAVAQYNELDAANERNKEARDAALREVALLTAHLQQETDRKDRLRRKIEELEERE